MAPAKKKAAKATPKAERAANGGSTKQQQVAPQAVSTRPKRHAEKRFYDDIEDERPQHLSTRGPRKKKGGLDRRTPPTLLYSSDAAAACCSRDGSPQTLVYCCCCCSEAATYFLRAGKYRLQTIVQYFIVYLSCFCIPHFGIAPLLGITRLLVHALARRNRRTPPSPGLCVVAALPSHAEALEACPVSLSKCRCFRREVARPDP